VTDVLADHQDATVLSEIQVAQHAWGELYSELDPLPASIALGVLARASRELLHRTAELPDTEQGLLVALTEYRYAVYALAALAEQLESAHEWINLRV
jgi:hypothetical protein